VAPECSFTPPAPPFSPFWFINRQRGNRLNYDLLKIGSIRLTVTENNFQQRNKEESEERKNALLHRLVLPSNWYVGQAILFRKLKKCHFLISL